MADNKLNVSIRASKVGNYFDYSCERFLPYIILQHPEKVGWAKRDNKPNASQAAGKVWEKEALKILHDKGFYCYAEDDKNCKVDFNEEHAFDKDFSDLSYEKFLEILRNPGENLPSYDAGKKVYIYQATIETPKSFLEDVVYPKDESRGEYEGMFHKDNGDD